MQKFKKYSLYLVIPAIFLVAFLVNNYRSEKEASTFTCKNKEITPEMVKELGGDYDEKTIKELNNETPYCKDLCLEQLDYSKKYSDWSAEENLRKDCADLGIILPKNN